MNASNVLLGGAGLLAALALVGQGGQSVDDDLHPGREALARLREQSRARLEPALQLLDRWPVDPESVRRLRDDTNVLRRTGWHDGLDILVPPGTPVVAPEDLRVIRVKSGAKPSPGKRPNPGHFVDALGRAGRVLRFLHLTPESVRLVAGQRLRTGERVGTVVNSVPPHLHFEVRTSDYDGQGYGLPINPVLVLPNPAVEALTAQLEQLRNRPDQRLA